jgi:YVTN family beta-propeller protein
VKGEKNSKEKTIMELRLKTKYLTYRAATLILAMAILVTMSTQLRAATGSCAGAGVTVPFEDITGNAFFCQIAGAYFSGLSNGTSATTYSPGAPVAREQMAAFVTRTLDQSLKRGSRRAALDQWWTAKEDSSAKKRGFLADGNLLRQVKSDGKDLWVVSGNGLYRVNAVTGSETYYPGLNSPRCLLIAMGSVFVAGENNGTYALRRINPKLSHFSEFAVTTVTSDLGVNPLSLAFDGKRIWTANYGGSVSIIDPSNNYSVTTKPLGIHPTGILFDGTNIWVTDGGNGNLLKMDQFGFVIQTVVLGGSLGYPVFDGTNIWAPDPSSGKVNVVRASNGALLATPQLNGEHHFVAAAFDGERVAVTDTTGYIHLWKATDFTYLGICEIEDFSMLNGICSDGTRFWATMSNSSNYGYLLGF